jgi:hypothetical protein
MGYDALAGPVQIGVQGGAPVSYWPLALGISLGPYRKLDAAATLNFESLQSLGVPTPGAPFMAISSADQALAAFSIQGPLRISTSALSLNPADLNDFYFENLKSNLPLVGNQFYLEHRVYRGGTTAVYDVNGQEIVRYEEVVTEIVIDWSLALQGSSTLSISFLSSGDVSAASPFQLPGIFSGQSANPVVALGGTLGMFSIVNGSHTFDTAAVPEPTTVSLLLAAVAALALWRSCGELRSTTPSGGAKWGQVRDRSHN